MNNIEDIFAKEFTKAFKAMNTNLCSIAESMKVIEKFVQMPVEEEKNDQKILGKDIDIMYLCDSRACPMENLKCYDQCRYTFDIEHAKNFRRCKAGDKEWYAETGEADKKTLSDMFHNIIVKLARDNILEPDQMQYVRNVVYNYMFPNMIKEEETNEATEEDVNS